MGSGKTTIGRLLSDRLGIPLADSDERLEQITGHTGRRLAALRGVLHLHHVEADIFSSALDERGPMVVTAAASIADRSDLLARAKDMGALVVVLEGDPEILAGRARRGTHRRTMFSGEAAELANARRVALRTAADLIVDVTTFATEEVAEQILRRLGAEIDDNPADGAI